MDVLPVIVPGCAGIEAMVTAKVLVLEAPQALLAMTETVPPVPPAVAEMLLVVLLPVQPPGRVQV